MNDPTPATGVFRHAETLRVHRADVDGEGRLHAHRVVAWFDGAMSGYWRALALPYRATLDELQARLALRRALLELDEGLAAEDERLQLSLRCARVEGATLVFEAACLRGAQRLAAAELHYAFVERGSAAPTPVPLPLGRALQRHEAGQPTVEVRVGTWAELEAHARPIRTAVFVDEQNIPAEMEWDAADAGCVHAVAYNALGAALATGRLLEHVPGTAKIGRMAVLAPVRGSGIGRAVLDALMDAARARGEREVLLHAQLSAAPFYLRAGFQPRGPEFDEAGIAHVEMVRGL
jgi:predicted GNAT family N-acyltransferase/acyl-CoA thioesterase FadM